MEPHTIWKTFLKPLLPPSHPAEIPSENHQNSNQFRVTSCWASRSVKWCSTFFLKDRNFIASLNFNQLKQRNRIKRHMKHEVISGSNFATLVCPPKHTRPSRPRAKIPTTFSLSHLVAIVIVAVNVSPQGNFSACMWAWVYAEGKSLFLSSARSHFWREV